MEDIFSIFKRIRKEISKRCVIIEFSDQNLKLVEAKLINKKISFRAFRNIKLPPEALNKGTPTDKGKMSQLITDLLNEENINTRSASVVLNSESIFIKHIYAPNNLTKSQAIKYLISSPNQQLPIPISQLDFDLIDSHQKVSKKNEKEFLLIAIPKKLTDQISETLNLANLNLKLLDFACISNTRLLYKEQRNLKLKEYILLLDFRNDATLLTLLDKFNPILIERISSIREYPHNFDEEKSGPKDYLELSKIDLRTIIKDINRILKNHFQTPPELLNYKIFIIGPNSAHPNLVNILGSLLNKNVYLISPTNCEGIYDTKFSESANEFFISPLIGTGLGLSFSLDFNSENSKDFKYIKKFIFDESKLNKTDSYKKNNHNNFTKTQESLNIKNEDNNNNLENKEINLKNKQKGINSDKNKLKSSIKKDKHTKIKSKKSLQNKDNFKFDNKFLE